MNEFESAIGTAGFAFGDRIPSDYGSQSGVAGQSGASLALEPGSVMYDERSNQLLMRGNDRHYHTIEYEKVDITDKVLKNIKELFLEKNREIAELTERVERLEFKHKKIYI